MWALNVNVQVHVCPCPCDLPLHYTITGKNSKLYLFFCFIWLHCNIFNYMYIVKIKSYNLEKAWMDALHCIANICIKTTKPWEFGKFFVLFCIAIFFKDSILLQNCIVVLFYDQCISFKLNILSYLLETRLVKMICFCFLNEVYFWFC